MPPLGSSFEELIRHNPTFKDEVINVVIGLLDGLLDLSENIDVDQLTGTHLWRTQDSFLKNISTENRFQRYFQNVITFIESALIDIHIKELVERGGVKKLMNIFTRPVFSYDFDALMPNSIIVFIFKAVARNEFAIEFLKVLLSLIYNFSAHIRETFQIKEIMEELISKNQTNNTANTFFSHVTILHRLCYLLRETVFTRNYSNTGDMIDFLCSDESKGCLYAGYDLCSQIYESYILCVDEICLPIGNSFMYDHIRRGLHRINADETTNTFDEENRKCLSYVILLSYYTSLSLVWLDLEYCGEG